VHEDNPAVANVCFSPNGRYVLAFNLDNCIRLWDYVAGSVKKTYQGHENKRFAVGGCFGALGDKPQQDLQEQQEQQQQQQQQQQPFIAAASEDGAIVLWDVTSKEVVQRLDAAHDGVCFWVDVHGDLMVSCGEDRTVRVYRNALPKRPTATAAAAAATAAAAEGTDEYPERNGDGAASGPDEMDVALIKQEDIKMEDA